MTTSIRVLLESTPKRTFASALDWPGLARGGRDEPAALEALLRAVPRYAPIASAAGQPLDLATVHLEVVERLPGDATTEFGAPSVVAAADREPTTEAGAARLAALVAAAWDVLDAIAAAAPEELRKGPRGGGRDRSKVMAHVRDVEAAYATVIGLRQRGADAAAITARHAAILALLQQPTDGSPLAGKRWPQRYAARRIAWHVVDHAWEIQDRSDSA